jgi:hypothetical protein
MYKFRNINDKNSSKEKEDKEYHEMRLELNNFGDNSTYYSKEYQKV